MSTVGGRAATTRGVLLRMREQLEFVKRGKELLEMKRDQLASETNKLLGKLKERQELDKNLMKAYDQLKIAYSTQGYSSIASQATAVAELEIRSRPVSIMGVVVPELTIEKSPNFTHVPNLSTYEVANQLNSLMGKLLEISLVEAQIEILARELMMTNRKVNALNKVLIPNIMELMRYIEGKLEEEMLEEFFRSKRLKKIMERGT